MFRLLTIAISVVFLAMSAPLYAADFRVCEDCHFEPLERDRRQPHQHQAFARNECRPCHVSAVKTPLPAAAAPTASRQQQPISWLTDSMLAGTSHHFLLAAEGLRETLVVSLRDQHGGMVNEEMPLPPLAQLAPADDDGRTPQIANVRVVEVKRGAFLSVTVAWQTDALAVAEVRYGTTELNQQVDSGGRLGLAHQLVLNQLQSNKTYRYQVISRDMTGRESVSEIRTFSTARAVQQRSGGGSVAADSSAATVMVDVRRHEDNYLLEVQLDQPRIVSIGSKGRRVELPREIPGAAGRKKGGPHAELSDKAWISIDSCHQCHEEKHAGSHPVNVLPPPGMIIPPEYPTLADGRVTCVSCHTIHGSEQQYMTRKRSKRELCVGCHQGML